MKRDEALQRSRTAVADRDVIVVGGGASGLGVAVDAASRGYDTILFEAHDFAKGTSSRSTKLVHGGVRYLAQGRIGLVREALRERGYLLRNAAHLVHDLALIIPAYRWWEKPFYRIGLGGYDMLAGRRTFGKTRSLGRKEVRDRLGNVTDEDLRGGVLYHDGQFDDARLAIDLARTAVDHGACVMNHTTVIALLKDAHGRVSGVRVQDEFTGTTHDVHGKCVINTTGVFTNAILEMDRPEIKDHVVPSQGVHLVLDRSFLPGEDALMIPRTPDGRVLFAIPWHGMVVVGTTDTLVPQPQLEPPPLDTEIDFILATAGRYLDRAPTRADVRCMYAGLRPLAMPRHSGQSTKEVSRSHKVVVSPSALISLIGGKWTTYRKMAEDTIDTAIGVANLIPRPCRTRTLSIHGNVERSGIDKNAPLSVYGSNADVIRKIQRDDPSTCLPVHPDFPFTLAEVVYAVRHEMAMTVEDVLARRVRLLFLDARAAMDSAEQVARTMATENGHDMAWVEAQVTAFHALARGYLLSGENDHRPSRPE